MAKIINISGVIGWDVTPQSVREQLQAANGDAVEVHISSPGGYISDGLEIFNLLRDYNGPISGVLKGYAMSMGSYIPLAIPLNRYAPGTLAAEDNAIYMIHNARGGVWGPHQDILQYGEALKGMSNMIAKAYARRTGKALEDVQAMMDAETYLFGEDIKAHGFVDSVIDTEDDATDGESARAQARTMFDSMVAKMSADQARMKADLQQVALMLAEVPPTNSSSTPAPAAAGNNKEEDSMTVLALAALLAANPVAKAEHDALVAQAHTDGAKAVEARVTAAAPFLSNPAYGAAVGAVALKVVKGEEAQSTLTAVVAVLDAQKEQGKGGAAEGAETPAAPAAPVHTTTDESGMVKDASGLTALVAEMKKGGA